MREIKFRLFDKDRNVVQIYTLNELISKTFRRGKFEYRGEFTGLKDKNGKEIYEGDILSVNFDFKAPVTFSNGCFQIISNENKGLYPLIKERANRLKITGNIYENPELLK